MSSTQLDCFKAYDIRGRLPDTMNADLAWRVGRALADFLDNPETLVVGCDSRLSSPALKQALALGMSAGGARVLDIGLCGTEEVAFAAAHLQADGGVMVTASHNPKDYNGMKLMRQQGRPISGDSGLNDIRQLVASTFDQSPAVLSSARVLTPVSVVDAYVDHLLGGVDLAALRPLKLVVNAGHGAAGHVIDAIEQRFRAQAVPIEFIKIQHEPDGHFPQGVPNPLLPECREATCLAVRAYGADMGIAWDGDFDRCFFFDETGQFIDSYYLVGLLATRLLGRHPGGRVVHDNRLVWNTVEQVKAAGGVPVACKAGHAFMKEAMRREDAIYGGEVSAHHYFRDFFYCDSGMVPWLLIAELMSVSGEPLSALVQERTALYPSSGEINSRLSSTQDAMARVLDGYGPGALSIDEMDGLSLDMGEWRFSLRGSNTEPLVRLNLEARQDTDLLAEKTREVLELVRQSQEG